MATVHSHQAYSQTKVAQKAAQIARDQHLRQDNTNFKLQQQNHLTLPPSVQEKPQAAVWENFSEYLKGNAQSSVNTFHANAMAFKTNALEHRFSPGNNIEEQLLNTKTSTDEKNTGLGQKVQDNSQIRPVVNQQKAFQNMLPLSDVLMQSQNTGVITKGTRQGQTQQFKPVQSQINPHTRVELDAFSLGLVQAVKSSSSQNSQTQQGFDSSEDGFESDIMLRKIPADSHTAELASTNKADTVKKREELESMKMVVQQFQQQLKAKHPQITVAVPHPDGLLDIKVLFQSQNNLRVLFSASKPELIQRLAQEQSDLVKVATKHGYILEQQNMNFSILTPHKT